MEWGQTVGTTTPGSGAEHHATDALPTMGSQIAPTDVDFGRAPAEETAGIAHRAAATTLVAQAHATVVVLREGTRAGEMPAAAMDIVAVAARRAQAAQGAVVRVLPVRTTKTIFAHADAACPPIARCATAQARAPTPGMLRNSDHGARRVRADYGVTRIGRGERVLVEAIPVAAALLGATTRAIRVRDGYRLGNLEVSRLALRSASSC